MRVLKERLPDIPEYVMSYADAQRLATQLGISLDGLSGDDYAMCNHRFERFVRPVEVAIRLGIVVPAENCGMVRDHKGEHHLHGAAYWQRAAEIAEARVGRVKEFMDEIRESALQEVEGFGLCGLSDEMLGPPSLADLEKAIS